MVLEEDNIAGDFLNQLVIHIMHLQNWGMMHEIYCYYLPPSTRSHWHENNAGIPI